MLRLDLIFSNWIFIWFVLFFFGIVAVNPTLIFIISFIYIVGSIFALAYYYKVSRYNLVKYVTINIFIKAIPILMMWYYNMFSVTYNDAIYTILFITLYFVYLYANGTNVVTVYKDIIRSYQNAKISSEKKTFFSNTFDHVYKKIIT